MSTTTQEKLQAGTSTAADAASSLAGTTKQEASAVMGEAKTQVKSVASDAKDQLHEHSRSQLSTLGSTLHTAGRDLEKMASGQHAPGMASDLVSQASTHLQRIGSSVQDRDPQEILDEVKHFAARRPGLFIACAVGAGLVAGRLIAGAKEANSQDSSVASSPGLAMPPDLTAQTTSGMGTTPASLGADYGSHLPTTPAGEDYGSNFATPSTAGVAR